MTTNNIHFAADEPMPDRPGPPRFWLIAAGSIATVMAIALIAIIVMALRYGETLPEITMDIVDAAAKRWVSKGPLDYDMDIQQTGVNAGLVHVEVRLHEVTAMTLNGRPTDKHLWDYWSVPGIFDVIRRDVEACMPKLNEEAQQRDPTGQAQPIVPRGLFDPKDGHPLEYHRIAPTGADVKWKVIKFDDKQF